MADLIASQMQLLFSLFSLPSNSEQDLKARRQCTLNWPLESASVSTSHLNHKLKQQPRPLPHPQASPHHFLHSPSTSNTHGCERDLPAHGRGSTSWRNHSIEGPLPLLAYHLLLHTLQHPWGTPPPREGHGTHPHAQTEEWDTPVRKHKLCRREKEEIEWLTTHNDKGWQHVQQCTASGGAVCALESLGCYS